MNPLEDIAIRALGPHDSIEELTALLHRSYAALGAMGLNYTAVDQTADVGRGRSFSAQFPQSGGFGRFGQFLPGGVEHQPVMPVGRLRPLCLGGYHDRASTGSGLVAESIESTAQVCV